MMAERGRPRVAPDSIQISVRVPGEWVTRADTLVEQIAPGFGLERADVWRRAIELGLAQLEREHGRRKR